MNRTYIKKVLAETFKAMDKQGYRKCEINEMNITTCIDRKAQMFVRVEATISDPGKDGRSYRVQKDFDL